MSNFGQNNSLPSATDLPGSDEQNLPTTYSGDKETKTSKVPFSYMLVPEHTKELLIDGLLVLFICFIILMILKYYKTQPCPQYCAKIDIDPDSELLA